MVTGALSLGKKEITISGVTASRASNSSSPSVTSSSRTVTLTDMTEVVSIVGANVRTVLRAV